MEKITRAELLEKIQKVMTTTPHTPEEWERAYVDLNVNATRFWKLEECMEQAIISKHGIEGLHEICDLATDLYYHPEKAEDEVALTEEQEKALDDILDFDLE